MPIKEYRIFINGVETDTVYNKRELRSWELVASALKKTFSYDAKDLLNTAKEQH